MVRLEPLSLDHGPALAAASSEDPAAYRWNVVPTDATAMAAYIETALADRAQGSAVPFATIRRRDGAVVGSTRFLRIERWPWPPESPHARVDGTPDTVEIGATWLAVSAQRTGINTEAKLLMLTHAFEAWNVRRVSLITDARNEQSRTAIARLGAQFEGVLRAHRIGSDGTVRDSARFSITAEEWPTVRARLRQMLVDPTGPGVARPGDQAGGGSPIGLG